MITFYFGSSAAGINETEQSVNKMFLNPRAIQNEHAVSDV